MARNRSLGRPAHISGVIWARALRMSVRQLVGQLVCRGIGDSGMEAMIAEGDVSLVMGVPDRETYLRWQKIARENGQVPFMSAEDWGRGNKICMPSGIAAPNSWNPALIEQAAAHVRDQCLAHGTSIVFNPVLDHALGNKQGRGQEGGAVESPLLQSRVGLAYVRGYQGSALGKNSVVSTIKHVGPYQYTTLPDYTDSGPHMELFLRDSYPPFKAALQGGAGAVMLGFVSLCGVPCHASKQLRRLNEKYGRKGLVVISDATGIVELCEFGVAATYKDAAYIAFTDAGIHIDLWSVAYPKYLPELVAEGKISHFDLQMRAAEVMQLKYEIGLFEDNDFGTSSAYDIEAEKVTLTQLACESTVLLRPAKPEKGLLPIPQGASIVLTGPLANDTHATAGDWSGTSRDHPENIVTILQGLKERYGYRVEHCVDASDVAYRANTMTHVVMALGEPAPWSGEAKARLQPRVPVEQVEALKQIRSAAPKAKIIVILSAGRALKIPDEVQRCADAILWAPQLGSYAGRAIAKILSGDESPSGRLAYSLPCHELINSGYSHREVRSGRPAIGVHPSSKEFSHTGWRTYYHELGLKRLAEFHFGEGYGYTTFSIGPSTLSATTLRSHTKQKLRVSALVSNTGDRMGKETVQLYVHDTVSKKIPRRLELLDFRQVTLLPGVTATVEFEITPQMLRDIGITADEHPVCLFVARHAGEAEDELCSFKEETLRFVFTK